MQPLLQLWYTQYCSFANANVTGVTSTASAFLVSHCVVLVDNRNVCTVHLQMLPEHILLASWSQLRVLLCRQQGSNLATGVSVYRFLKDQGTLKREGRSWLSWATRLQTMHRSLLTLSHLNQRSTVLLYEHTFLASSNCNSRCLCQHVSSMLQCRDQWTGWWVMGTHETCLVCYTTLEQFCHAACCKICSLVCAQHHSTLAPSEAVSGSKYL